MAYSRRQVTDGVTIMNKDLYDNVQDGIDGLKDLYDNVQDGIDGLKDEKEKLEERLDTILVIE